METKDLVKEIYTLLFPAALNEIKKDFADATNNEIRAIWKKVKPLFIEEVEELAKDPEDVDLQAGVRNALRKKLEGMSDLQQEIADLLEASMKGENRVAIQISHSKNVVAASTITTNGDFRVGDG